MPQSAHDRLPWVSSLFILLVFALSTPWNFSTSTKNYLSPTLDSYQMASLAQKGLLLRQAAMIALCAWALAMLMRPHAKLRINGFAGSLAIVLCAWACLSVFWSVDVWLTAKGIVRQAILCLAGLALADRLSLKQIANLILFICSVTIAVAIASELFHSTLNPLDPDWRLSGIMHPIALSWHCGLLAVAALMLSQQNRRYSKIYYTIALLALVLIGLTKSRMAFFTTIMSILIWWVLVNRKMRVPAFILGGAIYLSLACFLVSDDIAIWFDKTLDFGRNLGSVHSIHTLTGRIPLWNECFRLIGQHPIIGSGFNTFLYPPFVIPIYKALGWPPASPHSGYIEVLLGLGVVGFSLLVSFLATAIVRSIHLARSIKDYAFVTSIIVWLSANLLLESFLITSPCFPTFICIAMLGKISFMEPTSPRQLAEEATLH